MESVVATIIRRRTIGPLIVRDGRFKFIAVTYSTETLSPEVLRFAEHIFTEELLLEKVTEHVRDRTGHMEVEVILKERK